MSNVTGKVLSAEEICSPGYWVAHVREPVRFADGVQSLAEAGVKRFLEIGPSTVLAALAAQAPAVEDVECVFASCLRGARVDEREALLGFLAAAHCAGVPVDWSVCFAGAGARRVALPTYAFQRERYWLESVAGAGDPAAVGQVDVDHPLLGAGVAAAAGDEWLFTATWSLAAYPWMVDHTVFDTVLLPGTAFVELALCVGEVVGCEAVEELTIEAPLLLSERGGVQVQIAVGEPGSGGRREIEIYSRPEEQDAEWTRHASGLLTAVVDTAGDALAERLVAEAWPPPDAERIDTDDLYDRLAESGYGYGPAFQGVTAAWRRGEEVFAEVSLDDDNARHAADFGVHPALFDSAFHALLGLLSEGLEPGHVPLPFLMSGVRLLRAGAASLRVAVQPTGQDTLRMTALDQTGAPVLTIDSVMARTIDIARMTAARDTAAKAINNDLYRRGWVEVAPQDVVAPSVVWLGEGGVAAVEEAVVGGASVPQVVVARVPDGEDPQAAAAWVLGVLQAWLAATVLEDARLVVVTSGALAVRDGERPNLAHAAVPGLVRSAAVEDPLRFALVDLDLGCDRESAMGLDAALAGDEPELALRDGVLLAPRLGAGGGQRAPRACRPRPRRGGPDHGWHRRAGRAGRSSPGGRPWCAAVGVDLASWARG